MSPATAVHRWGEFYLEKAPGVSGVSNKRGRWSHGCITTRLANLRALRNSARVFDQKVPVIVPGPFIVAEVAGEAVFAITIEPVDAHELKANPAVANACSAITEPAVMYVVPVGLIVPEPDGLTMKETENCSTKSIS